MNDFQIENENAYNTKLDNKSLQHVISKGTRNENGNNMKQVETMENGKRKIKPIM